MRLMEGFAAGVAVGLLLAGAIVGAREPMSARAHWCDGLLHDVPADVDCGVGWAVRIPTDAWPPIIVTPLDQAMLAGGVDEADGLVLKPIRLRHGRVLAECAP